MNRRTVLSMLAVAPLAAVETSAAPSMMATVTGRTPPTEWTEIKGFLTLKIDKESGTIAVYVGEEERLCCILAFREFEIEMGWTHPLERPASHRVAGYNLVTRISSSHAPVMTFRYRPCPPVA